MTLSGRYRPSWDYLARRKIGGLLAQAGRSRRGPDTSVFLTAATDLVDSADIVKRAIKRILLRMLIATGRPLRGHTAPTSIPQTVRQPV